ncbi:MAG: DUF4097 family beta strand repeat protein [Candidatus Krumholzibacteriota bacterium]|nr:DUF4097 family beta strand repeat protein [Candidatus Krumholzibacteriota bacterium]
MKRMHGGLAILAVGAAVVLSSTVASADEWKVLDDSRWCRSHDWNDDFCEVRELTIDKRDMVIVDGRENGGIEVEGWDRDEIRIRVRVKVWADGDDDEAEEIARKVIVRTDGKEIQAEGPRSRRHHGWSVSYRLMVPHKTDLELETNNGGISVEEVEGEIHLTATNGGLSLLRLAGDVSGRTTNGGVEIELTGSKWQGRGLDVRSTNGGVSVEFPENYSAEIEAGTVNGGILVDFPLTVQGDLTRNIRATLGDGGPRIRAKTTNGGVHLFRM